MSASSLAERDATCPLCLIPCKIYIPAGSSFKVLGRDTDFLANYEGINPLFYEIWVCPVCHFSAYREDFNKVEPGHMDACVALTEALRKGPPTDFAKPERTLFIALASFRIALRYYEARHASDEIMGGLCLRLAKLCRLGGDRQREYAYLEQALGHYLKATLEDQPTKFEEGMLPYLVGELHLRVGDSPLAVDWFRKVLELSKKRIIRGDILHFTESQLAKASEVAERFALLRQVAFLSPLSDRELGRLEAQSHILDLGADHRLFGPGDRGEAMWVVIEGQVRESEGSDRIYGPRQSFGELGLLTGEPHACQTQTTMSSRLLVIEKAPFKALLAANPELSTALIHRFATMTQRVPASADEARQDEERLFEKLMKVFKL